MNLGLLLVNQPMITVFPKLLQQNIDLFTKKVAPQLSVVGIKCLKLWAKSEAHPKMSYIGNAPRNPVFIEDFSDECLVAV